MARGVLGVALIAVLAHCDAFASADPPTAPDASVADADGRPDVLETELVDAGACSHCRSRHCQAGGGCDPLVFVTAAVVAGDLGGASGDAICASEAEAPGKTFKAWLSDDTSSAFARMAAGVVNRPLWLNDNTKAAESLQALVLDGKPLHAIDRTAKSVVLPTSERVWTGTQPNGTKQTFHCQGWTTKSPPSTGAYGILDSTSGWTANNVPLTRLCSEGMHLYCFEIVAQ